MRVSRKVITTTPMRFGTAEASRIAISRITSFLRPNLELPPFRQPDYLSRKVGANPRHDSARRCAFFALHQGKPPFHGLACNLPINHVTLSVSGDCPCSISIPAASGPRPSWRLLPRRSGLLATPSPRPRPVPHPPLWY